MRSGHPEQVVAPRPSESRTNQFDILSEDRTKLPTQRRLGEPEGARPHGSAPPPVDKAARHPHHKWLIMVHLCLGEIQLHVYFKPPPH